MTADRRQIGQETARRNLRRANHALAKIGDEILRIPRLALAGPIGDDRAGTGAPKSEADKSPDEIEVTSEMVSAGREEMSCRWIEFVHGPGHEELWDEVLSAVFRAMWAARPRYRREF